MSEDDGIIMHSNRVHVPNSCKLSKLVMTKMHNIPYVGHLGYQNTTMVLRSEYFCLGMKKNITK